MTDADKLAFLRRLRNIERAIDDDFTLLAHEEAQKLVDDLRPHVAARLEELARQAIRAGDEEAE